MQLNPGDGSGIFDEINDLCDSDNNSYPIASKTRRCNTALLDLEMKALMSDGTWQFDDKNYSSLPTGLQTLVDGQAEYDFDSTLLFIERVEVLLSDGITWAPLAPLDETRIKGSIQNYLGVTGRPTQYYKRGNKLGLSPVPKAASMTLVNGLKVYFKRTGALFVTSDTTKEPGIIPSSHILIAQKAALPYCKTYKKDRVAALILDITTCEKQHIRYYSKRAKDEPAQMSMRRVHSR